VALKSVSLMDLAWLVHTSSIGRSVMGMVV
jgi:hypothetical protein